MVIASDSFPDHQCHAFFSPSLVPSSLSTLHSLLILITESKWTSQSPSAAITIVQLVTSQTSDSSMKLSLAILLTFTCLATLTGGQRRTRSRLPLIDSDFGQSSRYNKLTPVQQVNTCIFGNQTYEVNDKWKPNLGAPLGTLFCVRCECVEVNRKNHRTSTRVKCKNIKHDCPKPDCDEPVLLPGRCCKTCPGEDSFLEDDLTGRSIKRQGQEGKRIYAMVGKPNKSTSTSSISATLDQMSPLPSSMTSVASAVSPASVSSSLIDQKETAVAATLMDGQDNDHQSNDISSSHKCYYEGEIFEDGSQWKAQHQECQMCSCLVSNFCSFGEKTFFATHHLPVTFFLSFTFSMARGKLASPES